MIKIAGPTGPRPAFKRDLEALLDVPEEHLRAMAAWLASPHNSIPLVWSEFVPMSEETGLDVSLINQFMPLISFIMANWRTEGLDLDSVLTDLAEMGLSENRVDRAKVFFAQLESAADRFFLAALRANAEIQGLPTLDDIGICWDIRPIFEESIYSEGRGSEAVERWLTNIYLLVVELSSSYRDGKRETVSLQLTENNLVELKDALERASKQLNVLKKRQFIEL